MVKLALKKPALFTSLHARIVDTPLSHTSSMRSNENPLTDVLERLTEQKDNQELMQQLGKVWLTDDPEARFRKACDLRLTVHAEMQLLSFYDDHPELTPKFLFMGTSKKACFLCHRFLSRHPLNIGVSACHQKLYPSWEPAECTRGSVRQSHRVLLWDLNRHLEQTAARDLQTRLGIQRPRTLDSTAGPSLPTTSSLFSARWTREIPQHSSSSSQAEVSVVDDAPVTLDA